MSPTMSRFPDFGLDPDFFYQYWSGKLLLFTKCWLQYENPMSVKNMTIFNERVMFFSLRGSLDDFIKKEQNCW